MMDSVSTAGPQAAKSFASPCPGPRSHKPLAWDPSSIDFAFYGGGSSAFSTGAFTPGSTQLYKRRRVDTESSSTQPLFQSVIHTAYGIPETSFYEDAVDHRSIAPASYQDDYLAIDQSARAPGPSLPNSWNAAERMWCAPCLPTWSGFYAPLAQEPAPPPDKVETYRDEVPAQLSIVMQQYACPVGPQPPDLVPNGLVAEDMFPHQSQLSIAESPLGGLSESVAHHKDLGGSCRIDANRQIVPIENTVSGPLSVSCSIFDSTTCGVANEASSHQFGVNIESLTTITLEPSLSLATEIPPVGTGAIFVTANKIKPPGTRGPFKDQALREQTACTRQKGACLECQRQHIRCVTDSTNPAGPCVNCAKMLTSVIPRIPCLRYRMTEVQLSKPGQVPGYEWTRRWHHARKDIKQWASDDVKFIDISEGFSESFMRFQVREFVPKKGDKLERSWVHDGSRKSVPIPPFALVQLEDASRAYDHHMENQSTFNGAIDEILGLSPSLLRRTYLFAERFRQRAGLDPESKDLLDINFRLWMVVRLSTRSSWIVGRETLGMSSDLLDTSPDPGKIPLPPVLGAQLDSVLIHDKLGGIRRDLLRRLDRAFRRYKHENWLVTYLVSFTLLHNAALITAHDARYSQKHGMNRRFAREASVADYHQGAMVILAHFHNCTRNHPFSDHCRDSELHELSNMTDEEVRFIHDTRVYIKMHEKDWTRIRKEGLYEDDFYFASQLYLDTWEPHAFKVET